MDAINRFVYWFWDNQPIFAFIISFAGCILPVALSFFFNEGEEVSALSLVIFVLVAFLSICSYIQYKKLVCVPVVVGNSYDNAVQTLNEFGLKFEIYGDVVNTYVDDQQPEGDAIVKKGETIFLSFNGEIPDDGNNDTDAPEEPEPAPPYDDSSTESPELEDTDSSGTSDSETPEEAAAQDEIINIPPIETHTLSIDNILQNTTSIDGAEIVSYNDTVSYDKQELVYPFMAKYNGRYRFDISGLQNGTVLQLYLNDSLGNKVSYDNQCYNNEGITAVLTAGNEYTVKVIQDTGFSSYTLKISMQKERKDISAFTELTDSIEFKDQRNVYEFTVPRSGRYRFQISGIMNGTVVELYVFNDLMETKASDTYCVNGDGVTVRDLKAGETYEIQIRQHTGFSKYTLLVGCQKESVDISELTEVTDSVEFIDQRNVYNFKVPVDGRYRFEISGMVSGTVVELYMFDELGNTTASDTYCTNGEGITVKGLEAGDEYEVQVRQESGFSSYTLSIGRQKETVEIEHMCTINDSIEYIDQRNVYAFGTDMSGSIQLTISGMENGTAVEFYVYNELGETVAYDDYCYNDESLLLHDVPTGSNYIVQVRQSKGTSNYTLRIE